MIVQKTIINGISELLYTHDYVVVPGFGGFVSRHQLAHYSLSKDVLHPPSKKIMFNVQLKQNDGVLASWLKERIDCDFNQATKHIEEFAAHCKALLETKHRLEFENFGLFYLDFEKNICFEPKTDVNFLIESFGLSGITLKELDKEEKASSIETKDRFEKIEVKQPERRINYRRIAAIAIGIPVLSAALLFAVNLVKPNSISYSGLFNTGSETSYVPLNYNSSLTELEVKTASPYVVDANGYATLNLFENRTVAVNVSAVNTSSHSISKSRSHPISFAGKYQVVMGCFSVKGNANKFVRALSNDNIRAGISGTNAKGLHVVSCGAFNDKESALSMLQTIKSKYPSAWVMTQE
jgi:nucleoid DNA-binding protein